MEAKTLWRRVWRVAYNAELVREMEATGVDGTSEHVTVRRLGGGRRGWERFPRLYFTEHYGATPEEAIEKYIADQHRTIADAQRTIEDAGRLVERAGQLRAAEAQEVG